MPTTAMQSIRWSLRPVLFVMMANLPAYGADPATLPDANTLPAPVKMTAQQDHQRMMGLLNMTSIRPGANGMNPQAKDYANYDESKANPYPNLPDPLVLKSGQKVTTAQMWWDQRRPEIVEDFDREIYGRVPAETPKVDWELPGTTTDPNGPVPTITKRLVGHVDNSSYPLVTVNIQLTLTTPARASGPVPVMIQFGFMGGFGARGGRGGLGGGEPSWQQQVLAKGWGYAILNPNSVQADNGAGLTQGIIGLVNKGQPRKVDDWGALRAWAWGASRALDYFETDKAVDARQVGLEGHSRYGKATIVAMAYDRRFAIAYVSSSGEGGAKLHRRNWGEMVENVAGSGEYHWMAGNFIKYAGPLTWGDLPVDSHELVALCAPRPVFLSAGSVNGDAWVDAKGTFLAGVGAGPVYRLLGKKDMGATEFPPIETSLTDGDVAFRQHSGGHTDGPNWPVFLTFADRYIKGPPLARTDTATAPALTQGGGSESVDGADRPAPQAGNQAWTTAHAALVEKAKRGNIDLYFEGDSITRRWEATHKANWDQNFAGWKAADFGAGGDTTRNVLYRIEDGELDGVHPKAIVLLIGTNNIGGVPPSGSDDTLVEDVTKGVKACLDAMRKKAPNAKILLMGITPRNANGSTAVMPTINKVNDRIARFADDRTIRFLSINERLADENGRLYDGMTEDGLHLSNQGYQVWADAMKPILTEWLGPDRR